PSTVYLLHLYPVDTLAPLQCKTTSQSSRGIDCMSSSVIYSLAYLFQVFGLKSDSDVHQVCCSKGAPR
ncbi:hypothetical protein CRM22_004433, partial [Opisthorchis felineus]